MDAYPRQYLYLRIVRSKLFIDDNFASDIDLNNIAGEACFSKYHFIRAFRAVYGRTPHQYLTDVRIQRACVLLAAGETVAKACYSVGFDSVGSFTSLFKRRVGETPRVFQLHQLARRDEKAAVPLKFVPNCFAAKNGWS